MCSLLPYLKVEEQYRIFLIDLDEIRSFEGLLTIFSSVSRLVDYVVQRNERMILFRAQTMN